MNTILYKYRNLKNFKYFVDIILNNRLYASKYTELNDPMEGHYYYWGGKQNDVIAAKIKLDKERLRICSLTSDCDNKLMWCRYANKYKGVVIAVEVDDKYGQYNIEPIKYEDELPHLEDKELYTIPVQEILTHKLKKWMYEREERVFVTNLDYITVNIIMVIIGKKMPEEDIDLVTQLINSINPEIKIVSQYT